ncbi:aspartyl protease family protein 2 [Macadamia integrifolia]|uniref:aspartyl protease family protein 2 n=1 Tax=Macadamia integrifolia TaxID=60698 RepID=UPI001C4F4E41|nr:aspartyl protease family protein 2 [Macadamia integrifolia]
MVGWEWASSLLPTFLLSLVLLLCFSDLCNSQANGSSSSNEYLKLRLLHRSPFRSPSQSLHFDSRRLFTLFSTLRSRRNPKIPIVSGASSSSGQYFVDFRIGTPPQKLLLVADTGSDLIWVKCSACRNCSRNAPGTAFQARHSTTFSPLHCYDKACRLVPHPLKHQPCNHTRVHSTCHYQYTYDDGSRTSGFFSRETTTLNTSSGRAAKRKTLVFGCGFHVSGPSLTGSSFNGSQGVMGLGRGPISFSTQLGKQFGNKFSYCLMDYTLSPPPTSYLVIGESPESITKKKMRYTPLLTNPLSPNLYYVGIKSVSVNGVTLRINPSVWAINQEGYGGTIIDSGTTLTFLAEPAYRHILKAFNKRVRLPRAEDPRGILDLCVNVSGVANERLPRLEFKLSGGSLFSPPVSNYFIDTANQVKCLALRSVDTQAGGISVIGNLMQQGFMLEFDRDKSRLGFSRHGCALQ